MTFEHLFCEGMRPLSHRGGQKARRANCSLRAVNVRAFTYIFLKMQKKAKFSELKIIRRMYGVKCVGDAVTPPEERVRTALTCKQKEGNGTSVLL